MKKAVSLTLVFSILLLSGNMFAEERKGAELFIQKKDGRCERGELIAVKQNSILLLDRYSGADLTVDFNDVSTIRVKKKSQALSGLFGGMLVGGVIGVLSYKEPETIADKAIQTFFFIRPITYAVGGALLFGLVGLAIGSYTGKDTTIRFEGKSGSEIREMLEKLRKRARVKNAQ